MRSVSTVLLCFVLAGIFVVEWQLNTIRATMLAPCSAPATSTSTAAPAVETATQHDERLRRETRHSLHDADVIADEFADTVKHSVKRTSPKTP